MFTVLATLFSAASIVAAQAGTCTRTYTVKEGDYCDAISAAQNSSTYQLAVSNYQTINDGCTNLMPDQVVCLGMQGQDCTQTYIVQPGDYCDMIGSKFGINSTLLSANNPQIDENCYNLYVGEVLCVANTVLVTPAPAGWTLPGSNLDDGSFSDSGSSDQPAVVDTPTITTTSAAAATTSPAQQQAVNNAVVAPADNTDDSGENCDDDTDDSSNDGSDDNDEDDDLPDCD